MHTPLARLNEADYPRKDIRELQAKITPELVMKMCEQFGMVGCYKEISLGIAKTLWRYQSAALHALELTPPPQTKELGQLKKAIERALGAFEAITAENKSLIDREIMYRDPFNPKFFFKEQLDYWGKNENSTQTAINKLKQVSFALDKVKTNRAENAYIPKPTINTPLDHLIQDLSLYFQDGTLRKAKACCYYDPRQDNYTGQFFDFMVFILDHFAASSYHSHVALGKRIGRALGRWDG